MSFPNTTLPNLEPASALESVPAEDSAPAQLAGDVEYESEDDVLIKIRELMAKVKQCREEARLVREPPPVPRAPPNSPCASSEPSIAEAPKEEAKKGPWKVKFASGKRPNMLTRQIGSGKSRRARRKSPYPDTRKSLSDSSPGPSSRPVPNSPVVPSLPKEE
ncbi:hypothetical protein FZEAL_6995 [Fusarium zealandicum]|uniref:Uncharacterized protein n=1 Tax=Fusarium zealandicum TaxID=1053134 RepID=A0A8H4XI89_9HYPO|nr:hypothetical protein FZEAL_6995 [Fusarium zealandicum]